VIPARAGSKRLPRKNLRQFFGRPVICYAIDTAKRSMLFDEIVVSTDSEEAEQIALDSGVGVHWRSPFAASDSATDYDVILDVLMLKDGDYAELCYLYPITPLLEPEHLLMGYNRLEDSGRVLPVRGATGDDRDAGAFYWIDVDAFADMLREEYNIDNMHRVYLTAFEAQDVNTQEDWDLMAAKFMWKHSR
jgi:CMP-N-acetylneuraminic acid synthetase